ncbi:hypothetical protein ENINCP338B1_20965 [Enterobacter intestinihominis]
MLSKLLLNQVTMQKIAAITVAIKCEMMIEYNVVGPNSSAGL